MVARLWLPLGPVQLSLEAPPLPFPLSFLARPAPGPGRWSLRLSAELSPGAGFDGPLRLRQGRYEGPGFELVPDGSTYHARLAQPSAIAGALSAVLIDAGRARPWLVLHAGSLLWKGRAVLVLGRSGAGKSTLVHRHPARALGSNAALVFPSASTGALLASPLPLTGKGDAAVRPGSYPLAGALLLGAPRRRPRSQAEALAWWLSCAATAEGLAPPLEQAMRVAASCPVGGLVSPPGFTRVARFAVSSR